jgi:hypothetical protein
MAQALDIFQIDGLTHRDMEITVGHGHRQHMVTMGHTRRHAPKELVSELHLRQIDTCVFRAHDV